MQNSVKITNRKRKILASFLLAVVLVSATWIYESLVTHGGRLQGAGDIVEFVSGTKVLLALFFFLMTFGIFASTSFREYLFRFRYLIAGILFVVCVAAGIHGSSIDRYCTLFDVNPFDIKLGVQRSIRTDEWATQTPMTWSQYWNPEKPFGYFNSLIRAEKTDVFVEYALPVRSVLGIYRPFYWGYLFLPVANGMAFFWCGRLIALFMTSFEFGRFLTKGKRKFGLLLAFAITFSPMVQWWFAINGLVEMLIYTMFATMMFQKYLVCGSTGKRALYGGADSDIRRRVYPCHVSGVDGSHGLSSAGIADLGFDFHKG